MVDAPQILHFFFFFFSTVPTFKFSSDFFHLYLCFCIKNHGFLYVFKFVPCFLELFVTSPPLQTLQGWSYWFIFDALVNYNRLWFTTFIFITRYNVLCRANMAAATTYIFLSFVLHAWLLLAFLHLSLIINLMHTEWVIPTQRLSATLPQSTGYLNNSKEERCATLIRVN